MIVTSTEDLAADTEDRALAVVTGGTSGIGAAAAVALSRSGLDVVALARRRPNPENVGARDGQEGSITYMQADVTNRSSLDDVFTTLESTGRRVQVLVTAAGTNVRAPALEVSGEDVKRMLDVNLYGTFISFQVLAPLLLHDAGSRFIAIGSVSGQYGMNLRAVYGATKAGISGLVRSLAIEWAEFGATVNAVAPGVVDTPLTAGYIERFPERARALLDHTPAGRLGTPDDVAAVVAFLASASSSFITGQTIYPDGGLSVGCSWW